MSLIGRIKPGAKVRPLGTDAECAWPVVFSRRLEETQSFCIVHLFGDVYRCYNPFVRLEVRGKGVVIKGPYAVAKPHVEDWDETRVDIIGQNGNDGLHYPLRDS